jgi:epoxyqueuosine reductase
VQRKLDELAAAITELRRDLVVLSYIDTGAILEREWASSGGIGWFGKNTNLLHTEEGSYFFLGELLTNLAFEPEPLVPDHCGTCTRCLDLCPTQALKPGYILDARLCISYLTIEHRGPIPVELRPQLGNWIFGCDVCQEVCPWNEKLVKRDGVPDSASLFPYLPALLRLDDAAFNRHFQRHAIRRARREGFARNVAVALGNTRNPAAVPALSEALDSDPSPLVRGHAAWALGVIDDRAARRALELARAREPDTDVCAELAQSLERSDRASS